MDDNDDSFNERVVYTGEVYVMCSECGARLWSRDAHSGETHDDCIPCPYKTRHPNLARQYGCVSK